MDCSFSELCKGIDKLSLEKSTAYAELNEYMDEITALKDDFEEIYETFEGKIEESNFQELLEKISDLIKRYKKQENIAGEVHGKSSNEVQRIFVELQEKEEEGSDLAKEITEHEEYYDYYQTRLKEYEKDLNAELAKICDRAVDSLNALEYG
uniref:Uncharacterized protein n=1 Tax=Acrobeloides nanus TaxID=290746 RepID=A0A914E0Y4_9BILA